MSSTLGVTSRVYDCTQAYLARAAYYGLKGMYTKAILNCNEAIRLQPNSVRAYLYRCVHVHDVIFWRFVNSTISTVKWMYEDHSLSS